MYPLSTPKLEAEPFTWQQETPRSYLSLWYLGNQPQAKKRPSSLRNQFAIRTRGPDTVASRALHLQGEEPFYSSAI